MKEIRKTTQFKKDFKRYSKDLERVKALFEIVHKFHLSELCANWRMMSLFQLSSSLIHWVAIITITWNVTSEMIICSSGMTRQSMSLNLSA